ncbi:MAG TPA: hypothetical protein DDZ51_29555 [Planctomycetaceae bacterium]|nr:hypothetical protein [Planctomycetaceae bacterium]
MLDYRPAWQIEPGSTRSVIQWGWLAQQTADSAADKRLARRYDHYQWAFVCPARGISKKFSKGRGAFSADDETRPICC